jgi:hypothetical protein
MFSIATWLEYRTSGRSFPFCPTEKRVLAPAAAIENL